MNLDKAIELIHDFIIQDPDPDFQDIADALKLGIEALKKIDYLHITNVLGEDELLPGEDPPLAPPLSPDEIKRLRESPLTKRPGD